MITQAYKKLSKGDSFKNILFYWLPELITAIVFVTLPPIYDSYITAQMKSLITYGAIGTASSFLYTIVKLAEAIPVAAVAIYGRYNGSKEYEKCGEGLGDSFWTSCFLGFIQFFVILIGANFIFKMLGVPTQMIQIGASFLRIKSLGFFFMFTFMAFLGFMRSIKNTRIPMFLTAFGVCFYTIIAPTLSFGWFGITPMGQNGMAIATVIEFALMNLIALIYILKTSAYKKYFTRVFFGIFSFKRALHLLNMSWPIIIDKSIMSYAYLWLNRMIAPMGPVAIGSFVAVHDLERFAYIPVVAAGAIIPFLVSNRIGSQDYDGATANVKKVLLLASITTISLLILICTNSSFFISFFDKTGEFSTLATKVLPYISLLVIFDITQIILSGALRGAGDVKTVMIGRFIACAVFFAPFSWLMSHLPIQNQSIRFVLTYGSLYIATGVMGLIFLLHMRNRKWQKTKV